ncbi:MAG: CpaF family protein [Actinobacteria bacterium]|nr:CpaF family protein [Actinomycetota bacterium]
MDYDLVLALQDEVAAQLTSDRQDRAARGELELTAATERQQALSLITAAVARHMRAASESGASLPEASFDERLVDAVYAAIYGAGQLQELLDDPDVENIDINGADEVWVTYADGRGKQRHPPLAASDEDLVRIVQNRAAHASINARPFTAASPELDLRLDDGSRLSAVMGASERPVVSIRRNRFPQMFLDYVPDQIEHPPAVATGLRGRIRDRPSGETVPGQTTLLGLGSVDAQLAAFLRAAVLARSNVVVAGATDAGKTTLLRALIHCVPPHERLITVERALELGLRRHPELHPDVVELEEVLPDSDGKGGLSIDQLVRRTRRHNPSRVCVGEVMGPEVVQMLSAMSQGNDGSLSTIHARDAADVFAKLATYAAQFEGLPFPVTHALISSAIDFVVFIRKNPLLDERRCVSEVLEVTGYAEGQVTRSRIFATSPVDGRAERVTDVGIMRADRLAAVGYDDAGGSWYNPAWSAGADGESAEWSAPGWDARVSGADGR